MGCIMKNLRKIREKKHITQIKLSTEIGVSQETVSAYEKGKSMPGVDTLCRMADFFHVTTDFLLDRTSSPNDVSENQPQEEAEMLSYFKRLSRNKQARVIGILIGMDEANSEE